MGYRSSRCVRAFCAVAVMAVGLSGCSAINRFRNNKPEPPRESAAAQNWTYRIGPTDTLNIFVWRNPDLSQTVTVRPDGKFSTALVKEHQASGKTPAELARELEKAISEYVRDPLVTVSVGTFVGEFSDQVRVLGEASKPTATTYRKNMTVLDLMIQVGGLTEYAAGNRAVLVRYAGGKEEEFKVRLDDLIRNGDISANVALQPGDVLIIPESMF